MLPPLPPIFKQCYEFIAQSSCQFGRQISPFRRTSFKSIKYGLIIFGTEVEFNYDCCQSSLCERKAIVHIVRLRAFFWGGGGRVKPFFFWGLHFCVTSLDISAFSKSPAEKF